MSFSNSTVETLLVACHRHCCICHKPAGNKMEIHHIIPKSEGGEDTEENGIPLCFDCHAEVAAYNPKHPKGRKFTPSELRKHKEQWFWISSQAPWNSTLIATADKRIELTNIDDSVFNNLPLDDRKPTQRLVSAIMQKDRSVWDAFVKHVFKGLESDDDNARWTSAYIIEELVLWAPKLIPDKILEDMSRDRMFAVRSSAAVCYYYLVALKPASIPLDVLSKLAAYDEDWYVQTPATSALLRLARVRPVIIDIIARNLEHPNEYAREYAATTIKRLAQRDWDLLPDDLINKMCLSQDSYIREVGDDCRKKNKNSLLEPQRDYSLF